MIYPEFNIEIKNNKVVFEKREAFDRHLVPWEGKKAKLTIKRRYKKRSSGQDDEEGNQNGYFHAVIVRMISDKTGELDYVIKNLLKDMFLRSEKVINGKVYEYTRDTSDLDTIEFEKLCEKCRVWAWHELELRIPLPNEVEI